MFKHLLWYLAILILSLVGRYGVGLDKRVQRLFVQAERCLVIGVVLLEVGPGWVRFVLGRDALEADRGDELGEAGAGASGQDLVGHELQVKNLKSRTMLMPSILSSYLVPSRQPEYKQKSSVPTSA